MLGSLTSITIVIRKFFVDQAGYAWTDECRVSTPGERQKPQNHEGVSLL